MKTTFDQQSCWEPERRTLQFKGNSSSQQLSYCHIVVLQRKPHQTTQRPPPQLAPETDACQASFKSAEQSKPTVGATTPVRGQNTCGTCVPTFHFSPYSHLYLSILFVILNRMTSHQMCKLLVGGEGASIEKLYRIVSSTRGQRAEARKTTILQPVEQKPHSQKDR